MITEDYVSFETAKLLKEKGFDENTPVNYFVGDDKHRGCVVGEMIYHKKAGEATHLIACPTLQMAMKWLREVYKLVIEPYRTAGGYMYKISTIPFGSCRYDNRYAFDGDDENSGQWTTWEKSCEDGIKYCLENLI